MRLELLKKLPKLSDEKLKDLMRGMPKFVKSEEDKDLCFGNMDKVGCNSTNECGREYPCMLATIQRKYLPIPKKRKARVLALCDDK